MFSELPLPHGLPRPTAFYLARTIKPGLEPGAAGSPTRTRWSEPCRARPTMPGSYRGNCMHPAGLGPLPCPLGVKASPMPRPLLIWQMSRSSEESVPQNISFTPTIPYLLICLASVIIQFAAPETFHCSSEPSLKTFNSTPLDSYMLPQLFFSSRVAVSAGFRKEDRVSRQLVRCGDIASRPGIPPSPPTSRLETSQ